MFNPATFFLCVSSCVNHIKAILHQSQHGISSKACLLKLLDSSTLSKMNHSSATPLLTLENCSIPKARKLSEGALSFRIECR